MPPEIGLTAKVKPEIDRRSTKREAGKFKRQFNDRVSDLEATVNFDDAKDDAQDLASNLKNSLREAWEEFKGDTRGNVGMPSRRGPGGYPQPGGAGGGDPIDKFIDKIRSFNISENIKALGEQLNERFSGGGGGGGDDGEGGSWWSEGGTAGKVALSGLALNFLGQIKSGIGKLSEASPYLSKVTDMMSMAMGLFFRPIGRFLGRKLMPLATNMVNMALQFDEIAESDGILVGVGWVASNVFDGFAEKMNWKDDEDDGGGWNFVEIGKQIGGAAATIIGAVVAKKLGGKALAKAFGKERAAKFSKNMKGFLKEGFKAMPGGGWAATKMGHAKNSGGHLKKAGAAVGLGRGGKVSKKAGGLMNRAGNKLGLNMGRSGGAVSQRVNFNQGPIGGVGGRSSGANIGNVGSRASNAKRNIGSTGREIWGAGGSSAMGNVDDAASGAGGRLGNLKGKIPSGGGIVSGTKNKIGGLLGGSGKGIVGGAGKGGLKSLGKKALGPAASTAFYGAEFAGHQNIDDDKKRKQENSELLAGAGGALAGGVAGAKGGAATGAALGSVIPGVGTGIGGAAGGILGGLGGAILGEKKMREFADKLNLGKYMPNLQETMEGVKGAVGDSGQWVASKFEGAISFFQGIYGWMVKWGKYVIEGEFIGDLSEKIKKKLGEFGIFGSEGLFNGDFEPGDMFDGGIKDVLPKLTKGALLGFLFPFSLTGAAILGAFGMENIKKKLKNKLPGEITGAFSGLNDWLQNAIPDFSWPEIPEIDIPSMPDIEMKSWDFPELDFDKVIPSLDFNISLPDWISGKVDQIKKAGGLDKWVPDNIQVPDYNNSGSSDGAGGGDGFQPGDSPGGGAGGGGGGGGGGPTLRPMATGGIVKSATQALVGEGRETEAVLPLSKLESFMDRDREKIDVGVDVEGGTGTSGIDAEAIGDRIATRITREMRRNSGDDGEKLEAVKDSLDAIQSEISGSSQDIVVEVDGRELARVTEENKSRRFDTKEVLK